jgi:hypothetical protein
MVAFAAKIHGGGGKDPTPLYLRNEANFPGWKRRIDVVQRQMIAQKTFARNRLASFGKIGFVLAMIRQSVVRLAAVVASSGRAASGCIHNRVGWDQSRAKLVLAVRQPCPEASARVFSVIAVARASMSLVAGFLELRSGENASKSVQSAGTRFWAREAIT